MIDFLNQPGVIALLALATAAFNLALGLGVKKPIQDLNTQLPNYTDLVDTLGSRFTDLTEEHGKQVGQVLQAVTAMSTSQEAKIDKAVDGLDKANERLAKITGQAIDRLPG